MVNRTDAEQEIRRRVRWLRKRYPTGRRTIVRIVPNGKCLDDDGQSTRGTHWFTGKSHLIELELDVPHAMIDALIEEWCHARLYPDRNEGARLHMEIGHITEAMFYRTPGQ